MDERQAEMASSISQGSEEAEQRLHTADYVEARGILLPAVDYFRQAVENARAGDSLTGPLLVAVSEFPPASRPHIHNFSTGSRGLYEYWQCLVQPGES